MWCQQVYNSSFKSYAEKYNLQLLLKIPFTRRLMGQTNFTISVVQYKKH